MTATTFGKAIWLAVQLPKFRGKLLGIDDSHSTSSAPGDADSDGAEALPVSLMKSTISRFGQAWRRCDIEALMSLMGDTPLYRTSGGSIFSGRDAVREGFRDMCQPTKSAAPPGRQVYFANKCLSFWLLRLPSPDGLDKVVEGIDVITFESDGRIAVKDAYRKVC
jgi:hypothetical protein